MEVRKVEEDLAYKNILSLLNYDFERICYEIVIKEAYFRGIKDAILLLNRADLLVENL